MPSIARADSLWGLYTMLQTHKWVDLTHPFDTDIPHWKGFDPMTRKVIYDYDKDGFRAELFCHVGQWGTHLIRRCISIKARAPPTRFRSSRCCCRSS